MANNSSECSAGLSELQSVVLIALNTVFGIASIIGNTLVIWVIAKTKPLQTRSNLFILSLALADLMVGLVVNPLYIAIISLHVWLEENHPLIKAENYLWIQSLTATTVSLCSVSVERYIAISRPFHYTQIVTKKRCKSVVISLWVFSLSLACTSMLLGDHFLAMLWVSCSLLVVFPPLAIIVYCYCKIFKIARQHKMRIEKQNLPSFTKSELKNQKAVGTIVIIVGVFVFLFTPSLVFSVITIAKHDNCDALIIYQYWIWAICVNFSGSAINPWIYAIRTRDFRHALARIWGCNAKDNLEHSRGWKAILKLQNGTYTVRIRQNTISM